MLEKEELGGASNSARRDKALPKAALVGLGWALPFF
jgi:hypothetical protein